MQKQPENTSRKLIPRWREIARTPSRELVSSGALSKKLELNEDLSLAISDWKAGKTLSTALKLSEFGSLGEQISELADASEYILKHKNVRRSVKSSISRSSSQENLLISQVNSEAICNLKTKISNFPRHALLYCEIARCYANIGQYNKAEKQLEIARKLSPFNRYIIRSYVRFFVHQGDGDRALEALKFVRSSNDPWLLSALIATADLQGKTKLIPLKKARWTLEHDTASSQLSELAGSLATLELNSGANKRAKKLFQLSSIDPNDNAAAQIIWANEKEKINVNISLLDVPLSYEASARELDTQEKWAQTIESCLSWSKDEVFSVQPFAFGSYIAAEYLQDFERTRSFAEAGLLANPRNSTLLNNMAFALSELNQNKKANEFIALAEHYDKDGDCEIAIMATKGHILINAGSIDEGSDWYERAILLAKDRGEKLSAESAYLHWFKKMIDSGADYKDENFELIERFFSEEGKACKESKRIYKRISRNLLKKEKGLGGEKLAFNSPEMLEFQTDFGI